MFGKNTNDDDESSSSGVGANVVAYTAAITGCEYAGQWKQAFMLLDKMRKDGVEPNELTMGAVLGACATACANYYQDNNNNESSNNACRRASPWTSYAGTPIRRPKRLS